MYLIPEVVCINVKHIYNCFLVRVSLLPFRNTHVAFLAPQAKKGHDLWDTQKRKESCDRFESAMMEGGGTFHTEPSDKTEAPSFTEAGKEVEKKLVSRPTEDDLIDRNVIKLKSEEVAPALHAAVTFLEKENVSHQLEMELKDRATSEELYNRNVLKTKEVNQIDPSLQATMVALERERTILAVNNELEHRHTKEELHAMHIMQGEEGLAASLQAAGVALEKELTSNALKRELQGRPEKEELVDKHILVAPHVDPLLQAAMVSLERKKLEDSLSDHLSHRAPVETLVERHVLNQDEYAETREPHTSNS